ncbi:MAG TPA: carboxypeptidase-like regulatory domain-containing protein, partial [Thermoanaerobaculia bacterium]|nr:carboxypeptidase-like regulatory domain-containing protein [Thermoanaerobaculia bacterium]
TCRWTLPEEAGAPPCLAVVATLLGADGEAFPTPPLVFNARLSVAAEVAYDGAGCSHLADAETVQEALDRLCRNRALYYVAGDGQVARPGEELPRPLEARVTNGHWLEPGVPVRFTIVDDAGEGELIAEDGAAGRQLVVETGEDAVARVRWRLDEAGNSQRVEARLLEDGEPAGGPVAFNAGLAVEGGEPGIHIERVLHLDPATGAMVPLENDREVSAREIRILRIDCDAPLDSRSVDGKPSCFVSVEPGVRAAGGDGPVVGFHPVVVAATVGASRDSIVWRPTSDAVAYLSDEVFRGLEGVRRRVLARLTIQGDVVWGSDEERRLRYLDGEAYGRPEEDRVALRFPSGDGRRGGDFRMWFWLVPPTEQGPPFIIEVSPGQNLVAGRVTDLSGAPIPGIQVTLRAVDGNQPDRVALTGARGQFLFGDVRAGEYDVIVEAGGDRVTQRVRVGTGPIVIDPGLVGRQPVDRIAGIGSVFRDRLAERGVAHALLVADMEPGELARHLDVSESQATTLIRNARELVLRD